MESLTTSIILLLILCSTSQAFGAGLEPGVEYYLSTNADGTGKISVGCYYPQPNAPYIGVLNATNPPPELPLTLVAIPNDTVNFNIRFAENALCPFFNPVIWKVELVNTTTVQESFITAGGSTGNGDADSVFRIMTDESTTNAYNIYNCPSLGVCSFVVLWTNTRGGVIPLILGNGAATPLPLYFTIKPPVMSQ